MATDGTRNFIVERTRIVRDTILVRDVKTPEEALALLASGVTEESAPYGGNATLRCEMTHSETIHTYPISRRNVRQDGHE